MLPRAPAALSSHSELSFSGQLRVATSTALRSPEHHHFIQDPRESAPPLPGNSHLSASSPAHRVTRPSQTLHFLDNLAHPARASCPIQGPAQTPPAPGEGPTAKRKHNQSQELSWEVFPSELRGRLCAHISPEGLSSWARWTPAAWGPENFP